MSKNKNADITPVINIRFQETSKSDFIDQNIFKTNPVLHKGIINNKIHINENNSNNVTLNIEGKEKLVAI